MFSLRPPCKFCYNYVRFKVHLSISKSICMPLHAIYKKNSANKLIFCNLKSHESRLTGNLQKQYNFLAPIKKDKLQQKIFKEVHQKKLKIQLFAHSLKKLYKKPLFFLYLELIIFYCKLNLDLLQKV